MEMDTMETLLTILHVDVIFKVIQVLRLYIASKTIIRVNILNRVDEVRSGVVL